MNPDLPPNVCGSLEYEQMQHKEYLASSLAAEQGTGQATSVLTVRSTAQICAMVN